MRTAKYFELKYLLYSSWYDDASITKIVFLLILLSFKIGFPIFPHNLTSLKTFLSIKYKSLTVVDFPFVPVTVIAIFCLFKRKKISKSVIIFSLFLDKKVVNPHFSIFIPGLITIKSKLTLLSLSFFIKLFFKVLFLILISS